jgi:hypothetical protein
MAGGPDAVEVNADRATCGPDAVVGEPCAALPPPRTAAGLELVSR